MRFILAITALLFVVALPVEANSPALIQGIRDEYKAKVEVWTLSMQTATTAEAQQKIWAQRPDAVLYATKMWTSMKPSLAQDWTIEPASWLLKLVCTFPANGISPEAMVLRKEIIEQIQNAVAKQHLRSAKLAPMCMGLLAVRDTASLKLLERIEKENPDRSVQGVAALAIAILLQDLSEDTENMKRRLTLIRKAIIESAHVVIDGISVAKMADDQLYVIRFLTKNRVAPDFSGVDVTGANGKLSDFSGKVVVLLFWSTAIDDYDRVLEIHRNLVKKMAGKPFVLIGVTNDSIASLRALQADGIITWRNFVDTKGELAQQFRVQGLPYCYVLDRERKIQYFGNPGSFVELTADALLLETK
jgi:peroxiredoxin